MRFAVLTLGYSIGFVFGFISNAASVSSRSAIVPPAAHHRSALLPAPAEPFDLGGSLFQAPRP
jgi:hypothetical protein